jgi:hypothetical protein
VCVWGGGGGGGTCVHVRCACARTPAGFLFVCYRMMSFLLSHSPLWLSRRHIQVSSLRKLLLASADGTQTAMFLRSVYVTPPFLHCVRFSNITHVRTLFCLEKKLKKSLEKKLISDDHFSDFFLFFHFFSCFSLLPQAQHSVDFQGKWTAEGLP